MKQRLLLLAFSALSLLPAVAQQKYEIGNPNNAAHSYLNDYRPLKEYINYEKYPNFKLGIGTTVNDYLNPNSLVGGLTNDNFTETVAGNAMKMSSCVDGSGNMNFTTVTNYVNAATEAGLNVYGHTLAWHSQQPNAWLRSLIKDKTDPNDTDAQATLVKIASKDFTAKSDQSIGWSSDKTQYGFSISYTSTDGMKISTTKMCANFWDVQFQGVTNLSLDAGASYKATFKIRGTEAGKLHTKLGSFSTTGVYAEIPFTKEWKDVEVMYENSEGGEFMLMQCGDFVGDIFVKSVTIEKEQHGKLIPLTQEEKLEALTGAMEKWIKGMMEACDGKVKAWDVVNEAISGDGNDGEGNYLLQHAKEFKPGVNSAWDVGGDAFYWQDHMGDLEYVRTAVRLARKYGPEDIKLFINDYNLESTWDDNKKVKSLINWIKKWEADGVTKIDGIGTQMHISYIRDAAQQENQKKHIKKMFELLANSGKLVRVSEFDMGICDKQFSAASTTANVSEAEHKAMADYYEWIVKTYLETIPAEQQWGFCFWCPTDSPANSGWRKNEPVGLWTLDYYRKPAYAGVAEGLGGVVYNSIDAVSADGEANVGQVYDLQGNLINANLENLPSGFYVVGGRKIVK